jgi:hypothetical protein
MPDYLREFELLVIEKIAQQELNEAINLIIRFVEDIVLDTRATAKVFGSNILDNLCQAIGAEALANQVYVTQNNLGFENNIIYIATELYITGGHTAVLEDFIRFQPDIKHLILVTDIFGTGNNEAIKNRFSQYNIEFAPTGTYLDKLNWLQQKLIISQPSQVFLFNHHQDAVSIAAVQPTLVSQLVFYHHCDHNICLGLYLSHAKHIDLHSFGYYNCRNNLGVKNTFYMPLVAEDLGSKSSNNTFLIDGKLRTCSSGSSNKFEQPYSYVYSEEVPKILSITEGHHIHIGYLSAHTLDDIKMGLEKRQIDVKQFVYIPWVKSVWQAMYDQRVDVYISSFPHGGGRASVEVMGSGTPIIGHYNYHSCLLGGAEIIYPEAFSWSHPDELYVYLSSLTQEDLYKQSVFSRKHYKLYHTPEIFLKCLEGLWKGQEILIPSPLRKYFRDDLKAFLDEVNPYNLKLQHTQSELQHTQSELQHTQSELQHTQSELQHTQSELQHTQSELQHTQSIIDAMKTSKFWKLRTMCFLLKKKFIAEINE